MSYLINHFNPFVTVGNVKRDTLFGSGSGVGNNMLYVIPHLDLFVAVMVRESVTYELGRGMS